MAWTLADPPEDVLVRWIEASLATGSHRLAHGYQGAVYLYPGPPRLVIKAATGTGAMRWVRERMLRREYAVYQKLRAFRGSPRCYGLLAGRYLVLEHIEATPLRRAVLTDRAAFFDALFEHINALHARGVAHFDLKKKDNLLVTKDGLPCLIDYGAAIIRKPGFAPLNRYLYRLAERFDFNAWVKLKYDGKYAHVSAADRVYYRRSFVEKASRRLKRAYKRIKSVVAGRKQ